MMIDGPDFHDSDDTQVAIIPKACPYCGQSDRFSIRTGLECLQDAILMFCDEERQEDGE